MVFDEVQFFNCIDSYDQKSTEELLLIFKMKFINVFDSDMYDFIESITVRDAVLLLFIVSRFMDSLDWRV